MKKLQLIFICLFSATLFAQITVSTLTPPFKGSGGLSLDDDGNLYIGDFGDFLGVPDPDGQPNHVMKLDTGLNLTQYSTDFVGASGNDFDSNGVLFQSDIRANAIYKIINGIRTFVTSDGIVSPVGIVFDSKDNFYVCNCGDGTIRKVTPTGVSTQFASGPEFNCPNGITVDENDNLYVTNFSNTNIVKITPAGVTSVIGNTTAGNGNGHIDYDINLNTLYIANYSAHLIVALFLENFTTQVIAGTGVRGNDDGYGWEATFSTPNGIAVTDDGNTLYVNCAVPLTGATINPQIIRKIDDLLILGINETTSTAYNSKTYPNPTNDYITVEAKFPTEYLNLTIQIRDMLGHLVMEVKDVSSEGMQLRKTLNIANLSAGGYLYTVSSSSKQLFNGKIIKK